MNPDTHKHQKQDRGGKAACTGGQVALELELREASPALVQACCDTQVCPHWQRGEPGQADTKDQVRVDSERNSKHAFWSEIQLTV